MIDSSEVEPVLAHHVTWIHNAPKCDSCAVLGGLVEKQGPRVQGIDASTTAAIIRRCPRHDTITMETQSAQKSYSADASRASNGFLPQLIQGKSLPRTHRYNFSSNIATAKSESYLHNNNERQTTGHFLPTIAISSRQAYENRNSDLRLNVNKMYTQSLSRSLDGHERTMRSDARSRVTSENRSLPNDLRTLSEASTTNSGMCDVTIDEEVLLSQVSLDESESDDDDDDGEDMQTLSIYPYPYTSERSPYESDIDTTPRKQPTTVKQKRKKKKKEAPPSPPKPRPKRVKRPQQHKKKPINFAALRRHEQEVAKRHPIRKQFLYSHILETELKSYIPDRLPGGKLKPVYKRSLKTGDILLPEDPIKVAYSELAEGDHHGHSNSPWNISRRHHEALQAFLERRRKTQKHAASRSRRKRVRFILPPGHVNSASEHESETDDDHHNDADHENKPMTQSPENPNKQQEDVDIVDQNETAIKEDVTQGPVAKISHETLRDLASDPTRKNSEDLVHDWLQSTESSLKNRKSLGDSRPSLTDIVVKLPMIVESDPLPKISLTLADDAQIIPVLEKGKLMHSEKYCPSI